MVPGDGIMYLADAAVDDTKPEYQACYQTYYKHDMKRYLGIMDTLAKNSPVVPDQAVVPFPNYGIPVPYLIASGVVVVSFDGIEGKRPQGPVNPLVTQPSR